MKNVRPKSKLFKNPNHLPELNYLANPKLKFIWSIVNL